MLDLLLLASLNSEIVGRGRCESRPADGGRRLPVQPSGGGRWRRCRRCARRWWWRRRCCCWSRRQQALRILSRTRPRHYLPRLAKFTCKSCYPFSRSLETKQGWTVLALNLWSPVSTLYNSESWQNFQGSYRKCPRACAKILELMVWASFTVFYRALHYDPEVIINNLSSDIILPLVKRPNDACVRVTS